ncbi:MAG: NAD(P)-dependent alcohol dehydrogenase [Calditrichia bacterium]
MIKGFAAYEAGGMLKPFEYDPGPLKTDEVEIDVHYCGICYSDIHMIDNDWEISDYPFVPGHEVVGKISATGKNVLHLKTGEIVGLGWHAGYCMTCEYCLSGDHNLCVNSQATVVGHHGGFAEKVRARAASVVKLPDSIDRKSAGPLFCGGITVFNPLIQFNIKPTDRVGVIGIGGLGHLALQFLNAWGCEVTAFTSSEEKMREALSLGAHRAVHSRNYTEIGKHAGKFDFLISTVHGSLDWNVYLESLHPKGRLHFVGAVPDPLVLNLTPLIVGQRNVSGSPVGSPGNIVKMLDFAVRHNIKPVIEKFKFEEVNEAIALLRSGKAHYRIVLYW